MNRETVYFYILIIIPTIVTVVVGRLLNPVTFWEKLAMGIISGPIWIILFWITFLGLSSLDNYLKEIL